MILSNIWRVAWLTILQILLHCTDIAYIKDNLPWLIGSLGTMFEDVIVRYPPPSISRPYDAKS